MNTLTETEERGLADQLCEAMVKDDTNKLALYVWRGVLADNGIVCALAHDEAEAWDLLKQEDLAAWRVMRGAGREDARTGREDARTVEQLQADSFVKRPERVERPAAFVCWGG